MKGINELRRWLVAAPTGTTVRTEAFAEMLDAYDMEPAPEPARVTSPPLPWTVLLWSADPETRIGRAELLEGLGRSKSWLYRHTGPKAKHPIPHRKLDGELVFVVGEIRRWLRDREEIVAAGPMEAIRGRPRASRAEFERSDDLAQQMGLPYAIAGAQVLRAAAEFFALGGPERASVPLASMFSTAVPEAGGMLRRHHAQGRAVAAAICADLPTTPQEGPVAQLDCGAPVTTDSIHDTIETLERLGWEALGAGDLQRAIDIGNEPRLGRAGGVGLRARVPAAIAMERQGRADSAAAFFGRLADTPFGLVSNAFSAFLMQSYGLQRLAAMEGARGDAARATLREWWADAEPEFRRRVVEPLIGN